MRHQKNITGKASVDFPYVSDTLIAITKDLTSLQLHLG